MIYRRGGKLPFRTPVKHGDISLPLFFKTAAGTQSRKITLDSSLAPRRIVSGLIALAEPFTSGQADEAEYAAP